MLLNEFHLEIWRCPVPCWVDPACEVSSLVGVSWLSLSLLVALMLLVLCHLGHWLAQWPFFPHLLHVMSLKVSPSSPGVTWAKATLSCWVSLLFLLFLFLFLLWGIGVWCLLSMSMAWSKSLGNWSAVPNVWSLLNSLQSCLALSRLMDSWSLWPWGVGRMLHMIFWLHLIFILCDVS